jgi:uncharacterized pyridoxamine 5'-phosphate oxidase family protein
MSAVSLTPILLEAIKPISRVGDQIKRKEVKIMIWTIRCKKCFEPIENNDKSIEISTQARQASITIRAYCPKCNLSTVCTFIGSVEGEIHPPKPKPIRYR